MIYSREPVEGYVKSWIHKLMQNLDCKEIVFIDCMCNNGIYGDDGKRVVGTPIRVARVIADAMEKYLDKTATLYFNDSDPQKITELKKYLPSDTDNFHIELSCEDGKRLLKELQSRLLKRRGLHYLLFYAPYTAAIDWEALAPYFFGWGEVILNHMNSDSRRAIPKAKLSDTIDKYEMTYLTPIEKLRELHSDKNAYDDLIKGIIRELRDAREHTKYYLAAFPFFIKTNVRIYSIIFFTNSPVGLNLFKKTAWKTFGGKSSNQNTHGRENQLSLFATPSEDKQCYCVKDIADYIFDNFKGRKAVLLEEIWSFVDRHPIFPTTGYKSDIEKDLRHRYNCKIHGRKKKERTIDFV